MKKQIQKFLSNRTNQILVVILILILGGLGFAANKILSKPAPELPIEEVDLPFDPEGPYALIVPRRDGDAVYLNIFRVSSYESINYELAYQATGSTADEGIGPIDRGVQGTIDAKGKKSEYSQEILFGTCSQGYTSGGSHCVFDKNVENGTLTLRVEKPRERGAKVRTVYKMISSWHLQKPDVALGKISSADSHFRYETDAVRGDLANIGESVVNDLTAAPKLPDGKEVLGKVYALNVPTAKSFPKGVVTIELIDNPPAEAKIGRFVETKNSWQELETKVEGSKLTANAEGEGIFTVLVAKKN